MTKSATHRLRDTLVVDYLLPFRKHGAAQNDVVQYNGRS